MKSITLNFDKYLPPKEDTLKLSVYQVPREVNEGLKRLAKKKGVTVNELLRAVIRAIVEEE